VNTAAVTLRSLPCVPAGLAIASVGHERAVPFRDCGPERHAIRDRTASREIDFRVSILIPIALHSILSAYGSQEATMTARTAKLFTTGRSQAVRLPMEFRFEGTEVFVRRDPKSGDVILSRKPTHGGLFRSP